MAECVLEDGELWIGDGRRVRGFLRLSEGRIVEVGEGVYRGDAERESLNGAAVSPGLVDLMVLGGFNRSILKDDPRAIAREYLRLGVTSCQFCTGTLPWESMATIARKVAAAQQVDCDDETRVLGLYLEGPFQQPDLTGASLREHAQEPKAALVEQLIGELGEAVTMMNVAPSLPGAAAAVARFCEAGKVVSMAHSDAEAELVLRCLDAGTTVLGHVWDNNHGLIGDSGVQQPTIEHVALTDERVRAIHLICDGQHVHPIMVNLVVRCRGVGAICLVTDAVIRAGCDDGPFLWDDGRTFFKTNGVGRTSEGGLCGSALLLPDMFRNFVQFTGIAPHEAICTVTQNPAMSLNRKDIGLLKAGAAADLVVWDEALQIRRVWRKGIELSNVSDYAEITYKETT